MLLRHLQVQDLCVRNQVVFNPAKFKFGRREVGAKAWFGLVNQVAYSFTQTEQMAPFREEEQAILLGREHGHLVRAG